MSGAGDRNDDVDGAWFHDPFRHWLEALPEEEQLELRGFSNAS